jgi:hypothetical protein
MLFQLRHGKLLFREKGSTVGGQQRAHDMSQGTLKKIGNIKRKGHCAQCWTGSWRLELMGLLK